MDCAGELQVGFFVNDLVHQLTQDGQTRTYSLDPAGRFASETDKDGTVTGWRYADDSDAPAWLDTADGWSRPTQLCGCERELVWGLARSG